MMIQQTDDGPDAHAPDPLHPDTANTCDHCGRKTVAPCRTVSDMVARVSEGDRVCRDVLVGAIPLHSHSATFH